MTEVCQAIKTLICCGGNQDAMANKPVVIHNRQKYFRKKQKQQNIQRFFNATASADLSDIITTVFLINQCLSPYYTVFY